MQAIKTLREIKEIIENEKENNKHLFVYFKMDFDRIDEEKNNLIYKFTHFVNMYSLEKLKNILIKHSYGYIISDKSEIIIFPLV